MYLAQILNLYWLIFVPLSSIQAVFQDDPAAVLALTLKSKLDRYNLEMQKEYLKPIRKLIEKLKPELEVLEASGEKENAALLKDLLQKIDRSQDPMEAIDRIVLDPIPISLRIHHLIVEFEDDLLIVNKMLAERYEKMRQPILKDALRTSKQLAKSNPAAAERVKLFHDKLLAIESPKFNGEVPKLPADRELAEILYERGKAELVAESRRDIRREIRLLFSSLSDLRAEAVRGNDSKFVARLDEVATAFSKIEEPQPFGWDNKSKKSKDELDGQPRLFQVHHWIEANRKLLSVPLIVAFEEHNDRAKILKEKHDKRFAELDKQWASFASVDLKAALQSNKPYDTVRSELKTYLRLNQKEIPGWLRDLDDEPLPDIANDAMQLLSNFDVEAKTRLEEANRADAEIRQDLIGRLEALPVDQGHEAAMESLLKMLRSDYARGLRGTILCEVKPNLSAKANDLIEAYVKRSEKSIESLVKDNQQEIGKLAKSLASIKKKLVSKDDFQGAVLIDAHLSKREYPIPPMLLRVCSDQRPGSGPIVFAFSRPIYIVKREGELFWAQSITYFPLQFKRHQVMLGWEDCAGRTEQDFAREIGWSDYKQQPNDPPSRPIDEVDELEIGQEVLFCNHSVWKSGKVTDLSPTDVVVEYASFSGRNETQFVPRLSLRIVE